MISQPDSQQPQRVHGLRSRLSGQYTSTDFRALLKAHHGVQSLSRKGQCWDNAVGESWFAILKAELIYRHSWTTGHGQTTITQVRRAVIELI